MYFGISASAVVAALLAVGYSVDECMAAVAGEPGGRLGSMNLSLLRLGNLNYTGFWRRILLGWRTMFRSLRKLVVNPTQSSLDSMTFHYTDLMGPPFQSSAYEAMLRQILSRPGVTNDFTMLPRKLYIGASDQDARSHVVFGSDGHEDIPISKAVQASLSINPVFTSVHIDGRFYSDGAVTRTSNFIEAIRRGAKLIMVLDPFVPYVSKQPGFAHQRGLLYNIDQDLRTISYTRFENTRNWVLREHPEVSFYTFLPSNRIRRDTAVNPMDHRTYLKIWRGAYLSTLQRIKLVRHRLKGDLCPHGLTIDTSRAEIVAEQLQATKALSLADFFPGRSIVLRQPPLCLEPTKPARPKRKKGRKG
ncbi:MAG: hypothetical protein HY815_11105 [Candidatus Riflebacteria bacterium]|nr:hypothetical protein [Candidatus Riflebacteria bacterium]